MSFRIIRDDITKVRADAIVNPDGDDWQDETMIRQCYEKSLMLASEKGCASIAFPLMGTDIPGFSEERRIQTAVEVFMNFLTEHEMDIILVVSGSDVSKVSGRVFSQVESYIRNEYDTRIQPPKFADLSDICSEGTKEFPAIAHSNIEWPDQLIRPVQSLEEQLGELNKGSLSEHILRLIDEKGMKNSEVYTAANMSRQYFSKLLKGGVRPSKEKMLALSVGLRLSMDEARVFLRMAGYAFSPISQTDVIVSYFLKKKEFNVIKIDMVLFDYGLPCLSDA